MTYLVTRTKTSQHVCCGPLTPYSSPEKRNLSLWGGFCLDKRRPYKCYVALLLDAQQCNMTCCFVEINVSIPRVKKMNATAVRLNLLIVIEHGIGVG